MNNMKKPVKKESQDKLINDIITKLNEFNELLGKGPDHNLNIIMDVKSIMMYDPNDKESMNVKKYPEIRINIYRWAKSNKSEYEE